MVYAGIMGLVYPIGVPLAYGLVLYRSRATLMMREGRDDVPHVAAFKELWRPYRPEVFYYEVVECLRRVTLSVVVVFVSPSTAGQIATTFLFALLFFAMMLILDPYVSQWDTWLARIGHTIVVMTMFVALLEKVEITRDDMASRHVFADVLVAANCLLILAVVAEALGVLYVTARETCHRQAAPTHAGRHWRASVPQTLASRFPRRKNGTVSQEPPPCEFFDGIERSNNNEQKTMARASDDVQPSASGQSLSGR